MNTNPEPADAHELSEAELAALLEQLERATAPGGAAGEIDDAETVALRATWLQFTELLPADGAPVVSELLVERAARMREPEAGSSKWRLGVWIAAGMAAALALVWLAPRPNGLAPAPSTGVIAEAPPEEGVPQAEAIAENAAQPNVESANVEPANGEPAELEPDWEWEEFDAQLTALSDSVYGAGYSGVEPGRTYWRLDDRIQSTSEAAAEEAL